MTATEARVAIKSDGTSSGTTVTVDGKVLPVSRLELFAEGGGLVTATLHVFDVELDVEGDMRVVQFESPRGAA